MFSMRFFQDLPPEKAMEHLQGLSLRDLISVWITAKEMHPIIDADRALLRRLGVNSFEEFLDGTQALLKSKTHYLEYLEKLRNMVFDDGLPIATATFLVQPKETILNALFSKEEIERIC